MSRYLITQIRKYMAAGSYKVPLAALLLSGVCEMPLAQADGPQVPPNGYYSQTSNSNVSARLNELENVINEQQQQLVSLKSELAETMKAVDAPKPYVVGSDTSMKTMATRSILPPRNSTDRFLNGKSFVFPKDTTRRSEFGRSRCSICAPSVPNCPR